MTGTPATDTGLPSISDLHVDALMMLGLVEAMDDLRDRLGPQGLPLFAVIEAALPRMRKLTDDLEKHNDAI